MHGGLDRRRDLVAGRVGHAEVEDRAGVVPRHALGLVGCTPHGVGEQLGFANDVEADAVFIQQIPAVPVCG